MRRGTDVVRNGPIVDESRDLNREIGVLVRQLESLRDGDSAVGKLIDCGPAAIEPLKVFLREGRPSGTYEPRRWAVEALSGLGAKAALMDYLRWEKQIADPIVRSGEEAVESAAARELARWRTEDVFDLLTDLSQRRMLVGIVEALGEFGRSETIAYFDRALEDDVCRDAAEQAFRKIGQRAKRHLLQSSITSLPKRTEETPSSVRRRRSALRLLGEMELDDGDWNALQVNLDETDLEIVVLSAMIGARACGANRERVARSLLETLPSCPWYLHDEVEHSLAELGEDALRAIEAGIATREPRPGAEQRFDAVLRTLRKLKSQITSETSPSRQSATERT